MADNGWFLAGGDSAVSPTIRGGADGVYGDASRQQVKEWPPGVSPLYPQSSNGVFLFLEYRMNRHATRPA